MKISLILTTFNCLENLKITLKSISSQDYSNIEVVIADGLSTDGTVPYIQKFAEHSTFPVIWISERDSGIYDAMNKGYSLSSGDAILFFNDVFTSAHSLSLLAEALLHTVDCIGAHSDLIYIENNRVKRRWRMKDGSIRRGWMPGHPTLLLKRSVYETYGLYNTSYSCAADYEFMVRILKDPSHRLAYVPCVLVSMFYGGTSTGGLRNYFTSLKESYHALVDNEITYPAFVLFLRIIRLFLQFF